MPEITVYEGDNSKADYTLSYGPNWSDSTKIGKPVPKTDTTELYFYVNATAGEPTSWLSLNDAGVDANGGVISWLDTVNGKVRVTFGKGTDDHTGNGQYYEFRIKFADGTYMTVESGTFNVLESVVDEP